ncbi:MAG TPA: type II 3-dehydroquinate dehydratase [Devosia sp.]|nr:type II 3-dehydroquinate dehydratase [Devosia sp.]
MARTILIINGPNLNLLGRREPGLYGAKTLDDVEKECRKTAAGLGLEVDFRQSNHEGELIGWIQDAHQRSAGIIINPAAYSHTSIGIHDALRALDLPVIEVHISNIFARERYRHHSHVSAVANGVICGLGSAGYTLALNALNELI